MVVSATVVLHNYDLLWAGGRSLEMKTFGFGTHSSIFDYIGVPSHQRG
jgi:hypothetical protein